jgi:predicted ArsR family transcriptional regulator
VKIKERPDVVAGDDLRTRDAVARSILENGPSTAVSLGERLGLTPAGIRRHLDLLVADGILEARDPRVAPSRGRGRSSRCCSQIYVSAIGGAPR